MSQLLVDVPEALLPLCQPARYKAAYGGRGGAKSHFFAEQIILRCFSRRSRVVCIREVQASIRDSVRQLLIDKIEKLGLGGKFTVLDTEIRCDRNGSLIVFRGMQSYNAHNIKSLEDFDIAWVEEAQTLSDTSLRLLRPTIRKEGSEIWFSWNPRYETDPVDRLFRGAAVPSNAIVVPINWHDNPWFPAVLHEEKTRDYADDPETAEHVWGGGYERITAGAYFAKHVAAAEREQRVGYFPPLVGEPVYTGWDLGVDDYTAVWFAQIHSVRNVPRVRIVDYFESSDIGADEVLAAGLPEYTKDLQDRVEAMEQMERTAAFIYGRHFLPHDIGNREWGNGAKTRIQTLNELGVPLSKIHRGVAQDPEERINAVRRLLPLCEFNRTRNVMLGLTRLRRYSRKFNDKLGIYLGPLKDGNDHGADAFGEFAVNCGVAAPKPAPAPLPTPPPGRMIAPPPPDERRGRSIRL